MVNPVTGVANSDLPNLQSGFTNSMTSLQIQQLPSFTRMTGNGVPSDVAESIIRATPPTMGPLDDPIISIDGADISASDPSFGPAVQSASADADALFQSPGQLNAAKMQGFMKKAGPIVGASIMMLKVMGLDDLGEQNRVGGMMRDAMMMFGGPQGMMIAGAMTALPHVGKALNTAVIQPASEGLAKIFGALNLGGGSSAAGTTVDSTLIDPSQFDPAIMEEILLEVDNNPDFLGLGRPITRQEIMSGEVAIPDSFLADIAGDHELTLDDARGNAEQLKRGQGGIDVGHTRFNESAGGGTLSPIQAHDILQREGIASEHVRNVIMTKMNTPQQKAAFQKNPSAWLAANGPFITGGTDSAKAARERTRRG